MKNTYKLASWNGKRIYEDCTIRVACKADAPPDSRWVPCDPSVLFGLQSLSIEHQNGTSVHYFGWL